MMRLLFALLIITTVTAVSAAEPLSFNRHIRPILADRCFTCHGPDAATRKADLRLDLQQHATSKLPQTDQIAIVPGNPEASELIVRLTDAEQLMPPPESNLKVSRQEIALIRQWILEGAQWERHWAFIPPARQPLPTTKNKSWPKNEIDTFVLQRLEALAMEPTAAADRQRWLRRVTFDLTGLPPTLSEIDAFLTDRSDHAWNQVVERLLNSPAFGERMAVEWLDVARYGDTDGLFEDHVRSIYPWRDWVVDAFNSNLPYSDFITWQVAGDLLPEATAAQRIATGFIRNNPTSNEGGIIDEDYRVKYLVERVNTTATAMLGLTLKCAQCHDHKYDPMTQREYYQFAGFFNSLTGNGNTKGATAPIIRSLTPEQTARIAVIDQQLVTIDTTLKSTPPELITDFEEWITKIKQPVSWVIPNLVENDTWHQVDQWIVTKSNAEPQNPKPNRSEKMQGRYVRIAQPKGHTGYLTISEVQVFSDGINVARSGKATQSSVAFSSPASKAINGDHNGSFGSCACTAEETNAWWELDLGTSQAIDSVVVWNRTDCCPERLDNISIEILDEKRKAVSKRVLQKAANRNALPAGAIQPKDISHEIQLTFTVQPGMLAALQFESEKPVQIEVLSATIVAAEKSIKPVALKLIGNRKFPLHDKPVMVALESVVTVADGQRLKLIARSNRSAGLRISLTGNENAAVQATLPKNRDQQLKQFHASWSGFNEERMQQAALTEERKKIDALATVSMVAGEMATQRTNYFLARGEYDQRGAELQTAAPATIMAYPDDFPKNRLGLAQWLTDPQNPLTARVAVNRYWQMIFGTGIVKTSEDFGTQGDRPSHQELLDHLTTDFVESGWDVKALLRKMVLSATYRQSSIRSTATTIRDPDNRLLSHGPRRRLQAEFLRNHVLSISGLLVNQPGGPGVHPYQPAELFGRNAIGSSGAKFTLGSGDDLYRRSLYTYWKRQIPAANLRILGADGRIACRTRREMTNTPLQALVTLNDPQFVESARVLAERVIREGGKTPAERLHYAFQLATSRQPAAPELVILLAEFQDRLAEFKAQQELSTQYLAGGGFQKPPADLNPAELAAYAATCSLIINLDESLSK